MTQLRVRLYEAMLLVHADAAEWSAGLKLLGRAFSSLPDSEHQPLWVQKVRFMCKGGGRGLARAIPADGGSAAGERPAASSGPRQTSGGAADCGGPGGAAQDPEGWLSSGMLRVEARPISANPSRDRMMDGE